ncbi:MAG: LemA family protein [Clostridia bacterium]|nr:LemA family protein [Clostridia bacterium]
MNLLISSGAIAGIVCGVIGFVLIVILIWGICARNNFVRLQGQYEEAFHNIDIYLKKRFDLIPNLVETVKGYAKHESQTLQNVIDARAKAQAANTPAEKIEANAQLTKAMHMFNMVVEQYPELKANTNFLDLQGQLKAIETELAHVRKYYNATVKQFNVKIRTFPASIIARMMHLEKQPYFELDDPIERQNVRVQF